MSRLDDLERGVAPAGEAGPGGRPSYLTPVQRRQAGLITAVALLLYLGARCLPTGTNLNHMDFRMTGKGALEFCDPLNPQFIPVVQVRSPVVLTLKADREPALNQSVNFILTMRTASGKPIAPEDLLVAHTRKLHLLVVDPTLTDYQHLHPEPGRTPGEWTFSFTPHLGGKYLVFADFTPAATARGLYASAEVDVAGGGSAAVKPVAQGGQAFPLVTEREGYRFLLEAAVQPIREGQPADLKFSVTRPDGGPVPMELVMDAYAHLVAFDEARSGFAHLHPMETDLTQKPDATRPVLNFKITIPRAGKYVIWAQVKLGGREVFAPFAFDVAR